MRIFLDTADVDAIRKANDTELLDGIMISMQYKE